MTQPRTKPAQDGVEQQLHRIRGLWNEASDAQVARLLSVLISEAGAANNYRTPIHLMNPLTGEIEDWATIAQPTVDDVRVPYYYPRDWPRPWITNDGENERE